MVRSVEPVRRLHRRGIIHVPADVDIGQRAVLRRLLMGVQSRLTGDFQSIYLAYAVKKFVWGFGYVSKTNALDNSKAL